ncbi:hypothetical protein kac65v162_gp131 [Nodularia phage vB_NspS-kac65v162]|jgi:hypothetical protein|uniref:Uncharacterized protein n=6 Tax=Ravarandavirus TaxID=2843444 RepID=A0A482MK54_9CAUD|nr:hypothetical protein HWA92_gp119 [Nodularia phage vB_NpeS-2AV2]YP_009844734.1 hypothetical protein HWC12_gp186 [Nodularia phage vB_NspS-kac65v151]YP_009844941.1 hypothetical protein HWC13_gp179 [Nodularia phage vB_NspS-kac68v161]QBQ73369.1 hypothetical protein kac65v161_gp131 [Nodularia phage vB_NspS-kac65v161]QBQ73575.1 hypothetical protein kac65v162_gp131 [Nodularia phage vB_NspS-kac65v162]QBQ73978.1 hypothetical protein kac68v162_gp130 [Nodularia phage vB_NspS-kac68v162]ALY07571.1 hypot
MPGKLNLSLNAPATYTALGQWTGVSQATVNAALNGDQGAAAQILDFSEQAKARASNAETILNAATEGVEALGEVIALEAQFLGTASQTFTTAAKAVNSTFQKDKKFQHSLIEGQVQHRLAVDEENVRHKRALNLLPMESKTRETIAGINYETKRYQLNQQVNEARENRKEALNQLSTRQKQLQSLQRVGGGGKGLGSPIANGVKGFFNFLFGH